MSRDKPVLETRNLTHSFGDGGARKQVLREVSVGVRAGETCLIIGPSGSGKSTLLAILSGLLRPDSGRVVALGEELGRLSGAALKEFRRRHCGFIFQGYNLFPALTARQQLEIVLLWGGGASANEARRRSDEMLALLGMESRADLRPDQLSGGEKQRSRRRPRPDQGTRIVLRRRADQRPRLGARPPRRRTADRRRPQSAGGRAPRLTRPPRSRLCGPRISSGRRAPVQAPGAGQIVRRNLP